MKASILSLALALSSTSVVLGSLASESSGLEQKAPKTFVVNCAATGKNKGAGETCNTMCFGANCHFNRTIYTFDNASDSQQSKRRTKAGCVRGKGKNPCENNPAGNSCDEFPFASTSDADTETQIYRCVKKNDNDSQGGQVSNMRKNVCKNKFPCQFSLSFQGEQKYQYCKPSPNCTNDGNIFTKGNKPVRRDLKDTPTSEGGYFQLRSGETIYSPIDLSISTVAIRQVWNATVDADLETRDALEEDDDDFGELVEDEVVSKL
ncbi:hypothetical protein F5B20DRAFT_582289 [Whalleya microplaca]|nr:hypothetical protein F5B20DRAFT_582289 [Whalleya microplaca]